MIELDDIFARVKKASRKLGGLSDDKRSEVLRSLADALLGVADALLEANAMDLAKMSPENPLYDRLQLTPQRLEGIASDMRHVASLPSPLGEVMEERMLPNGLQLRRVRVPFGVIGVIYEARPNVTFDVFSLCFKSGNACVLKGGSDAENSNRAIVSLIHKILREHDIDEDVLAEFPQCVGAASCHT